MNDFSDIFIKNEKLIGEIIVRDGREMMVVGIEEIDEGDYHWVLRNIFGVISYVSFIIPLEIFGGDAVEKERAIKFFSANDKYERFPMFHEILFRSDYVRLLEKCHEFPSSELRGCWDAVFHVYRTRLRDYIEEEKLHRILSYATHHASVVESAIRRATIISHYMKYHYILAEQDVR